MKITQIILLTLNLTLSAVLLAACAPPAAAPATAPVPVPPTAALTPVVAAPTVVSTTPVAPPTREPATATPPKAEITPVLTTVPSSPGTLPVEALPENAVLVLRREGGFAGRRDLWTVYKTGRIETNKGETQQIGADAVTTLLKDVADLGFFTLKDTYRNSSCADCFEYTLTATYAGQTKTVHANDAGDMPATLRQIIDRVTRDIGNVQ